MYGSVMFKNKKGRKAIFSAGLTIL